MAVFFPNFMGARQRARDSQRKSDLYHMRDAMELYKLDQVTPAYPDALPTGTCPTPNQCWSQNASCGGNIYMRKVPCDPSDNVSYTYTRNVSDNTKYELVACLENSADPDRDGTIATACTTTTNISYTVYEP